MTNSELIAAISRASQSPGCALAELRSLAYALAKEGRQSDADMILACVEIIEGHE